MQQNWFQYSGERGSRNLESSLIQFAVKCLVPFAVRGRYLEGLWIAMVVTLYCEPSRRCLRVRSHPGRSSKRRLARKPSWEPARSWSSSQRGSAMESGICFRLTADPVWCTWMLCNFWMAIRILVISLEWHSQNEKTVSFRCNLCFGTNAERPWRMRQIRMRIYPNSVFG